MDDDDTGVIVSVTPPLFSPPNSLINMPQRDELKQNPFENSTPHAASVPSHTMYANIFFTFLARWGADLDLCVCVLPARLISRKAAERTSRLLQTETSDNE